MYLIVTLLADEVIRECNSIKKVIDNGFNDIENIEEVETIRNESLRTSIGHLKRLVELMISYTRNKTNLDDMFFAGELTSKKGENDVLYPGDEEVLKNGNT